MEFRVSDASEFVMYSPASLDVVMGPLGSPPVPGRGAWAEGTLTCAGGTVNQVIVLTRLGVSVYLHSHVGVDQVGALVGEILAREGVDTSSCERVGDQNVTVSLSSGGGRAMTTRETAALSLLGGDAPVCLLTDVQGVGASSEVISSWRAHGTWVLADAAWDEAGAWGEADLESLLLAGVRTPNGEEALACARTESVEDAARWFTFFECDCVVTYGKNGMIACVNGQILRVPVLTVNAADTTDVGDVFPAALAWACRTRRMPWPEAFALACAAAAYPTQGIGGPSSAPYVADLPGA